MAKKVAVLGSTGSVGGQALEVIRKSRGRFAVHSLAAMDNVDGLMAQVMEFRPGRVALARETAAVEISHRLKKSLGGDAPEILEGREGVLELAADPRADVILNAVVGSDGLLPTLAALDAGLHLALANKESLVMAGPLVMAKASIKGTLVPVDSEHSSIHRCLEGRDRAQVCAVILTASGGAFRNLPVERLKDVTPEEALNHPVWSMGHRITVDSASMMNKALEIIEAQHLFGVDPSRVRVVLHPQAYVHGLVELTDGTLIAHLGLPDMKTPIAFALDYPDCEPGETESLDLAALGSLSFERPDHQRYPSLALGYKAAQEGGTMPAVMNAADEVAVKGFIDGRITFPAIAEIVSSVMKDHDVEELVSIEQALEADSWGRNRAAGLVGG